MRPQHMVASARRIEVFQSCGLAHLPGLSSPLSDNPRVPMGRRTIPCRTSLMQFGLLLGSPDSSLPRQPGSGAPARECGGGGGGQENLEPYHMVRHNFPKEFVLFSLLKWGAGGGRRSGVSSLLPIWSVCLLLCTNFFLSAFGALAHHLRAWYPLLFTSLPWYFKCDAEFWSLIKLSSL